MLLCKSVNFDLLFMSRSIDCTAAINSRATNLAYRFARVGELVLVRVNTTVL
jgi:hypothetical protein